MVDGKKDVKACLVAKGRQDPDVGDGLVETSGCVSLRSSHLRVISLGALKKLDIWILDVKSALLRTDGFCRGVFLRAPVKWDPKGTRPIWGQFTGGSS